LRLASSAGRSSSMDDFPVSISMVRSLMRETVPQAPPAGDCRKAA
jgi:hypothetical protein